MSKMALVIAFVLGLIGPASAQKAEIEAANAKYTEFYNKGDFAGMASLYTDDAMALPNGSAIVQGRAAIEAMWKDSRFGIDVVGGGRCSSPTGSNSSLLVGSEFVAEIVHHQVAPE